MTPQQLPKRRGQPPFIHKLWWFVKISKTVIYDKQLNQFIITDKDEFVKEAYNKNLFKHGRIESFFRQLSNYRFKTGGGLTKFSHPDFTMDGYKLNGILRQKEKRYKKSIKSYNDLMNDDLMNDDGLKNRWNGDLSN